MAEETNMKRTYRLKKGYGKHYVQKDKGKKATELVKPGETIEAYPEDIAPFMDKFEDVTSDVRKAKQAKAVKKAQSPKKRLELREIGGGMYDVVNPDTDEPINVKPLTEVEAKDLVEDHKGGPDPEPDKKKKGERSKASKRTRGSKNK